MKTTTPPVSVGIDVSKDTLDVALLHRTKESESLTVTNTREGVEKLIDSLNAKGTSEDVPLVCESTGDYHLLSSSMLQEAGFQVNTINPLITKHYERASIRGAKTDRVDAVRLSEIGILETDLPLFDGSVERIQAKKMVSLLSILETTRQKLSQHGRCLSETEEALGFSVDAPFFEQALENIKKQIMLLKDGLALRLPAHLTSFAEETKGLSDKQLGVIYALVGEHHFPHRDKLVAFFGLDVRARQSGKWKGREHLSKRGSAYGRKVLYQIAMSLRYWDPTYKAYYRRLKDRGKHHNTAMAATSRKFLRHFYAVHYKG